jgi:hypothetical protein
VKTANLTLFCLFVCLFVCLIQEEYTFKEYPPTHNYVLFCRRRQVEHSQMGSTAKVIPCWYPETGNNSTGSTTL